MMEGGGNGRSQRRNGCGQGGRGGARGWGLGGELPGVPFVGVAQTEIGTALTLSVRTQT